MAQLTLAALVVLGVCLAPYTVSGHGRMLNPAGRASLWRYPEFSKFNPEPNYNDNENFCGGVVVQYGQNNGKCGVCGDPWNAPVPRKHEAGSVYAKGIITGEYRQGQIIEVEAELTATHMGYFEFRICPQDSVSNPATQECFDTNVLKLANGVSTRHPIPDDGTIGIHRVQLRLPEGLTCERCVLQWHYNTGNSYGVCDDGSSALGCGNQEIFRACSDISIV